MVLAIEDLMVFGLLDLLLVWTGELVTGKKIVTREKKINSHLFYLCSVRKKRKLAEPIQPWWYNMQQWTVYYM